MSPGPTELVLILLVILLLFGAARIPRTARSLGEAARELRAGRREDDDGLRDDR